MTISKKKLFLSILIITILAILIIFPAKYISVAWAAIETWAKILLPSLLPFFVFTKILTSLGYVQIVSKNFEKITYKLYKCPPISAYVFVMSILTGYPVGSKLISNLYTAGNISKNDAKKCATFTSNSGPMFILGSVGIGMLTNKICGLIIYFSHILGAIFNGILYRNIKEKNQEKINKKTPEISQKNFDFSDTIMDSINSIFLIGGIIIIAFIFIQILIDFNVFFPLAFLLKKIGINTEISNCVFCGFFEITKGCLLASSLQISIFAKTIICCGIITFGGLSTTFQSMAFLSKIMSFKFFFLQKITHTIISLIICVILCLIFI